MGGVQSVVMSLVWEERYREIEWREGNEKRNLKNGMGVRERVEGGDKMGEGRDRESGWA